MPTLPVSRQVGVGRGTVGDGARWPAVRAGAAVGLGVVALSGRCGPAAVRVVALEGGERAEARPSSAATETGLPLTGAVDRALGPLPGMLKVWLPPCA